jgi:hypothetical protein
MMDHNDSNYTDKREFKLFQFEDALIYHLTYHGSQGIHINHLIFSAGYVFGIMLLALSIQFEVALAILALYTWYCVKMEYYLGMTYSTVLVVLFMVAFLVWYMILDRKPAYYLLLGIILGSLVCQLIGHRIHENVQASPNILHGLVAAPFLEWCSLFYRRKRNSKVLRTKFDVVAKNLSGRKSK